MDAETDRALRPGDRFDPETTWIIDRGLGEWWVSRPKTGEEDSYSSICKFGTPEEAVLYAESFGCDFRVADFEVDLEHLLRGVAERFNPWTKRFNPWTKWT